MPLRLRKSAISSSSRRQRRSRQHLFDDHFGHRRLRSYAAQKLHRVEHFGDVVHRSSRHSPRSSAAPNGSLERIMTRTAAGRPAIGQADRKARPWVRRQDRPLAALRDHGREGLEVELHVGPRLATGRCGRSRRPGSCSSIAGRRAAGDIACRPASLPHHGRRTWLSVGDPGLPGVVDADDDPAGWRRHSALSRTT